MEIQATPQLVVLRARRIGANGKWERDLTVINTWRTDHAPWETIDSYRKDVASRADRKDIEVVVQFQGTEYVKVLTAQELAQELADEPKKEKETNAGHDNVWRWTAVCEHHGHPDLGKKVGLFLTQGEAARYARACWKAWSTEPIFDATT